MTSTINVLSTIIYYISSEFLIPINYISLSVKTERLWLSHYFVKIAEKMFTSQGFGNIKQINKIKTSCSRKILQEVTHQRSQWSIQILITHAHLRNSPRHNLLQAEFLISTKHKINADWPVASPHLRHSFPDTLTVNQVFKSPFLLAHSTTTVNNEISNLRLWPPDQNE